MKMLRISKASAIGLTIVVISLTLFGCAANSMRHQVPVQNGSDSISGHLLIVDPWSLGPDVFQTVLAETADTLTIEKIPPTEHEQQVIVLADSDTLVQTWPSIDAESPPAQPEALPPSVVFFVQLGTFLDQAKAQEFCGRASSELEMTGKIQGDWPFYRVRFGEFYTRQSADSLHRVAMSHGFYDARVLKSEAKE